MPEQESTQKNPGKKPGNPKMRQLREQNAELAASNSKLRQDREALLHQINTQKKSLQIQADEANEAIKTIKSDAAAQAAAQLQNQQALEAKIKQKNQELQHKDNIILMAQDESERARAEVLSYANSTSWKITSPIRALINIFK